MKGYQKLLEPESVYNSVLPRTDFEFNTGYVSSQPTDVVFCGKVITRKAEPGSAMQKKQTEEECTSDRINVFVAGLRSPSGREKKWRRSNSDRKSYTGMFGTMKFPLRMELSDIKLRQERMEPKPLPKFTVENGGDERCLELIRPLQRRWTLIRSLKSSFRLKCVSIA